MNVEHTALIDQSRLVSLINPSISWAQLERGKLDIEYRVAQVGPLVISSRTSNLAFQVRAALQPGRTVVGIVESLRSGARWFGQEVDARTIAVRRDELDIRTMAGATVSGIAVDHQELQAHFPDSLDASDLFDRLNQNRVSHDPVAAARLRSAVRSICFGEAPPERTISGTLVPLLAASLSRLENYAVERSAATNRRFAAVRACEIYMRDHLDTSLTILDLSCVCQMRSRTLINAFEAITGFGPMEYLKRLRLSAVHRALGHADRSRTRIIDVATEWGFWHMGHFARDYRIMFGESPSQTLLK
jgi:AraC family transcriptional regulator, ethanolamine operon transcriptional activator